jgi:hypothetical protein
MKTRKYPENPNCPLSDEEKVKLGKVLDDLEWEVYAPLRHLSSAYADATVTEYDEFGIEVELEYGCDSTGSHYKGNVTYKRSDFTPYI